MLYKVLVVVWSFCFWGAPAVRGLSTEQYSLRLFGGDGQCRGELQVQRRGEEWRGVSPSDVLLPFGDRACAELDCGPALSMKTKTVSFRHAVQLSPQACEGSSLIHCLGDIEFSEDTLELNCSDSVRLVSGQSLCSGSLQIRDRSLSQSWTSVCDGALDRRGAEVLCRELGCGAPLHQGELSPLGQTFQCEGHESALMNCPRGQSRSGSGTCSGSTLHLTCSEPVRLAGGPSRCEGTAEVKYRGDWRRVMPSDLWDLKTAAAVCRVLDCGSAVSIEQKQGLQKTDVWQINPDCVKTKAAVRDCVRQVHSETEDGLQVVCSGSVRLVSERSLCSGSLQIRDQSWTSVCEGALDRRGAEVLCRELGCGTPLLQGELSALGQMFQCAGHESALMNCPRGQSRSDSGTCSGQPLHLTCSEPVRLMGGASRCEGTVELNYRGEWRRVLSSKFYDHWDLETAAAVCRDLNCGSAVSVEEKDGFTSTDVWVVKSACVKKAAAVRDCACGGDSGRGHGLKVVCSDSVRLVSGRSLCSGALHIRDQSSDQPWTSVCEGDVGRQGAEVLCRELACGAPRHHLELSPLGQVFHCEGHESALGKCPRKQTKTGQNTCSGPAAHLTCSEPVRLVEGAGRCDGTLEVMYRGEWRRVRTYDPYGPWDLEAAASVCLQLDCGFAVSTGRKRGLNATNVWHLSPDCVKTTSVRDCVWAGFSDYPEDLEVVCSDSMRLVTGQTSCSGSLLLRDQSLSQSWTSVCEGALGRQGEEVLCRELGCGAPLLQGERSPLGQMFQCEGHESALMDCPRNQTGTKPGTCSGRTLNITCTDPVRLVGGASRCEGTVEVKYKGYKEWRRAMMSNLYNPWDIQAAESVCRSLRCGSAVSTSVTKRLEMAYVWFIRSDCVKTAIMRDCVLGGAPAWDGGLNVVCSGKK